MILLDASDLGASRPGRQLFEHISLTLSTGDRLGLVGINGTGKSTLLRVLAGKAEPEQGTVRRGRHARVVMLDQADDLPAGTVHQAVAPGAHHVVPVHHPEHGTSQPPPRPARRSAAPAR